MTALFILGHFMAAASLLVMTAIFFGLSRSPATPDHEKPLVGISAVVFAGLAFWQLRIIAQMLGVA